MIHFHSWTFHLASSAPNRGREGGGNQKKIVRKKAKQLQPGVIAWMRNDMMNVLPGRGEDFAYRTNSIKRQVPLIVVSGGI